MSISLKSHEIHSFCAMKISRSFTDERVICGTASIIHGREVNRSREIGEDNTFRRGSFGANVENNQEDAMQLRRTTSFFVLSLITAFILSACGGGGGGDSAPAPLAPTTTTSNVNTPGIDNAVINGSVNPNGLATTAWFEYGTDNTLSTFTKTADQAIAVGTVPQSINATLLRPDRGNEILLPGRGFQFRGYVERDDSNFTTHHRLRRRPRRRPATLPSTPPPSLGP